MDTAALSAMYAQIVNGVKKTDSRYVTDQESSRLWDTIAKEVDDLKKEGKMPSMINEIPDVPHPDSISKVTGPEEQMKQLQFEFEEAKDREGWQ